MKNLKSLFLLGIAFCFLSCNNNDNSPAEPVAITLNFSHFFNNEVINASNFSTATFTNGYGTDLMLDRARYVISDITLTHQNGEVINLKEYNLVDIGNQTGLSFTTTASISPGQYSNVSFRFGFSEEDNGTGVYADLTTLNFDVPAMLGGGYHYMQMDGTYINSNNQVSPFNYHAISSINMNLADPNTVPSREDSSFEIDLGPVTIGDNTNMNVNVDLAGWFNSPSLWVLDVWDVMLMGNYQAQLAMNEQGQTGVFSLESITQE